MRARSKVEEQNENYSKSKVERHEKSIADDSVSCSTALPIMIQGTGSDAGKSILATALCRIFARKGYRTAPFKSQNMALNAYVTLDGKEIGRSQGVQAEAAGIAATTEMNPILLKPSRENESQVVVHGKPYRNVTARAYRTEFFEKVGTHY